MSPQSPGQLDPATRRRVERDFDDLRAEFVGLLGAETVEQCLNDSLDRLTGTARVPNFVPLLAQRFARQQLRAVAQGRGLLDKPRLEILFIDSKDAGRSQIAAALFEHHAPGVAHVRTAGTDPAAEINPTVTAVLATRGLHLPRAYPKPLTAAVVVAADVVVTLGCPDAAVRQPGQRRYDWDVGDPDTMDLTAMNALCADIEARIKALVAVLPAAPDPTPPAAS